MFHFHVVWIMVASACSLVNAIPFSSLAPRPTISSGVLNVNGRNLTSFNASDLASYPTGSITQLLFANNLLTFVPADAFVAPSLRNLINLDLSGNNFSAPGAIAKHAFRGAKITTMLRIARSGLTGQSLVPGCFDGNIRALDLTNNPQAGDDLTRTPNFFDPFPADVLPDSAANVLVGTVATLELSALSRWNATRSSVSVTFRFAEGSQPSIAIHQALVPPTTNGTLPAFTTLSLTVQGSLFAAPNSTFDLVSTGVTRAPVGMQLGTLVLPYASPFLVDPHFYVPLVSLQSLSFTLPFNLSTNAVQWDAFMPSVLSDSLLASCYALREFKVDLRLTPNTPPVESPVVTSDDYFFAKIPAVQSGLLTYLNLAGGFQHYPDHFLFGLEASVRMQYVVLDFTVLYGSGHSVPVGFFDQRLPGWAFSSWTMPTSFTSLQQISASGRFYFHLDSVTGLPVSCPAGSFPSNAGDITNTVVPYCARCTAGSACPTNPDGMETLRVPCPAGTFGTDLGRTSCQECAAGTWSDKISATSPSTCIPCLSGTASNHSAASDAGACLSCRPGTFSVSSGAQVCEACPAGMYQELFGSSQCTRCPAGTWLPSTGAASRASCLACPAASPNSPAGSTSFDACTAVVAAPCRASPGYLPSTSDPSVCDIPCPLGHVCVGHGVEACPAGTYSDQLAATFCKPCAAGTFSTTTGAISSEACMSCPRGTFSDTLGSKACLACPSGSAGSIIGASSASQCVAAVCQVSGVFCPAATSQPLQAANFAEPTRHVESVSLAAAIRPTLNAVGALNFASTPALNFANAFLSAAPASTSTDDMFSVTGSSLPFQAQMALILTLGSVALMLLVLYRCMSMRLSRKLDLFSMKHSVVIGEAPHRLPTQLGTAFTLAFFLTAIVATILLATAKNERMTTGLVLPTAYSGSGTARSNIEWVLHAHADVNVVAESCLASSWVSSSAGFDATSSVSVQQTARGTTCEVVVTCWNCNIAGHAVVQIDMPWQFQVVEYQLYASGARRGAFSRYYGVTAPKSASSLLAAETIISFSLAESFFIDSTMQQTPMMTSAHDFAAVPGASTSGTTRQFGPAQTSLAAVGAGYQTSFVSSATASPAPSTLTTSTSSRITLSLEVASLVDLTRIEQEQSVLQIWSGIISLVVSLLSIFVVLFKATAWVLGKLHRPLGDARLAQQQSSSSKVAPLPKSDSYLSSSTEEQQC